MDLNRIDDEVRILPYPFPIEEPIEDPIQDKGCFSSEASFASSTSHSSFRRMRTETFTYPTFVEPTQFEPFRRLEKLREDLNLALKEGRYEDGIRWLEEFEADWNDRMCDALIRELEKGGGEIVGLRPFVTNFVGSLIDINKAFYQALGKKD